MSHLASGAFCCAVYFVTFWKAFKFKRIALAVLFFSASAQASELILQDLIQEAVKNNPEIL
ncbi:MAG: hypothetical protein MUQ20_01595, partial [Deltaproteobacteria bacterium]|nr:hypothetical protein [Deltaproteobacteria bacterium]